MITSRDNPHLKHARAVRKGKVAGQIFIEGLRLCEEAVASGARIVDVLYTSDFSIEPRGKTLLAKLKNGKVPNLLVPENLLESVTDTKTPQGIVMVAERLENGERYFTEQLHKRRALPLVVVLHEMNNPSNLGAILRTAEAAGAAGAVITKNSADPYSPKALRGAMGASFRLPIWHGSEFSHVIEWAKTLEMLTACADINGTVSYLDIDWRKPHALIVGSEAHGLNDTDRALCDESFMIPMAEPVESLNAAVAAGIVMFEARRAMLY